MKLSKNFYLAEFIKSETAARRDIDNLPSEGAVENLISLCENTMQPIRNMVNRSVNVTSGFRCLELNTAIGGSKTSQHVKGQACDFYVNDFEIPELVQKIIDSDIPFDQIIDEFSDSGHGWIHISYRSDGNNRRQSLKARRVNGKTVYSQFD